MGNPLVIDEAALAALKKHGEKRFIILAEMRRIVSGQAASVGDRNGYSLDMEVGYRVVFSVEEHPQKDGSTVWLRHMSISQVQSGRAPNQLTLGLVGKELGFPMNEKAHTLNYEKCQIWLENKDMVNAVCEVEKPNGS